MTARQISEAHRTDARAHKAFHIVADLEKHAANLAIDALSQDGAQSRRREGMQSRDLRSLAVEKNAAPLDSSGNCNGHCRAGFRSGPACESQGGPA